MQFNLSELKDIHGLESFDLSNDASITRQLTFSNGLLSPSSFPAEIKFDPALSILNVRTTSPIEVIASNFQLRQFNLAVKVKDVQGVLNFDGVEKCDGTVALENEVMFPDGLSFLLQYMHGQLVGNAFTLSLVEEFELNGTGIKLKPSTKLRLAEDGNYVLEGNAEMKVADSLLAGLLDTPSGTLTGSIRLHLEEETNELEVKHFNFAFTYSEQKLSLIRGASVNIHFTRVDDYWTITMKGSHNADWALVSEWLIRNHLVAENIAPFPSTECIIDLAYTSKDDSTELKLVIKPQDGDWPGMPVHTKGTAFETKATLEKTGITAWTIGGRTLLSLTGEAFKIMPVTDAEFKTIIDVDDNSILFEMIGGLPALKIPNPLNDDKSVFSFRFAKLSLKVSEEVTISGEATYDSALNLNDESPVDFLQPIWEKIDTLLEGGTLRFSMTISPGGYDASLKLDLTNAGEFELFQLLAKGLIPDFSESSDPARLLSVRPGNISLSLHKDEQNSSFKLDLNVAANLISSLEFAVVPSISISNNGIDFSISTGTEPVLFSVPMPMDPALYFDAIDTSTLESLARHYGIDPAIVINIKEQIKTLLAGNGSGTAFVFGLSNLGFKISAPKDVHLEGSIELIHLPAFLDQFLPADKIRLTLGGSIESLYILLETEGSKPLLHLPFGKNSDAVEQIIDLYIRSLKLSYDWKSNAFGFGIDQSVDFTPDDLINAKSVVGGFRLTDTTQTGSINVIGTTPPIPYPEWKVLFSGNDAVNATDELGLQAWIGPPDNYVARLYLKENSFSPTMFCFMPGLTLDGGFLLGNIDPSKFVNRTVLCDKLTHFNSLDDDKGTAFVLVDLQRGTLVMINQVIGMILNPTMIPPPLQVPPSFALDFYFDRISLAGNVPGLMYMSISVTRTLPQFDLFALLDMFGLIASGFSKPVRPDSSLASLMNFSIRGELGLQVFGASKQMQLDYSISLIDILNTGVAGLLAFRGLLREGGDILRRFISDPSFVIDLVPKMFRWMQVDLDIMEIGFRFSGSVYLLTPDEFRKELRLFHENELEIRAQIPGTTNIDSSPIPTGITPINVQPIPVQLEIYTHIKLSNPGQAIDRSNPAVIDLFKKADKKIQDAQNDFTSDFEQVRLTKDHAADTAQRLWRNLVSNMPLDARKIVTIFERHNVLSFRSEIMHLINKEVRGFPNVLFPGDAATQNRIIRRITNLLVSKWMQTRPGRKPILNDRMRVAKDISAELAKSLKASKKLVKVLDENNPVEKRNKLDKADYNNIINSNKLPIKEDLDKLFIDFHKNLKNESQIAAELEAIVQKQLSEPVDNDSDDLPNVPPINHQEIIRRLEESIGKEKIFSKEKRQAVKFNAFTGKKSIASEVTLINPRIRVLAKGVLELARERTAEGSFQIRSRQRMDHAEGEFFISANEVLDISNQILGQDTEWEVVGTNHGTYSVYVAGTTNSLIKPIPSWLAEGSRSAKEVKARIAMHQFRKSSEYMFINKAFGTVPEGTFKWRPAEMINLNTVFRVVHRDSRYLLALLNTNTYETKEEIELPDWLTDNAGADSCATIRSRLTITEQMKWMEASPPPSALATKVDKSNANYLRSIFSRPEYKIRNEGGKHGAFYLGDMLIDGERYTIPSSPTFVAGLDCSVLGHSVHFAGLISGDKVFLRGAAAIEMVIGNTKVVLDGEFIALSGSWQVVPDEGLAPNSMNFKGVTSIQQKEQGEFKEKFKAQAAGRVTQTGFSINCKMDMDLSGEFNLAGYDLAKAIVEFNGDCTINCQLGRELSVSTSAKANVEIRVLQIKTRWIHVGAGVYRPEFYLGWSTYEENLQLKFSIGLDPFRAIIQYDGVNIDIGI